MAVRPLLIAEPKETTLPNGKPCIKVRTVGHGDLPVLNLNVTIRGQNRNGEADAYSTDRGSLPAGMNDVATLELEKFLDESHVTWGPGLELVVTWHGILGQWIVERYEWNYNLNRSDPHSKTWRLYRLEIVPTEVKGASSIKRRSLARDFARDVVWM